MSKQRTVISIALSNLSTWMRQQRWFSAIYRHVPIALRQRTSEVLARQSRERIAFERTPRWSRESASVDSVVIPRRDGHVGSVGLNIFAYFRGQFGLAEAARSYARALMAEGYPVAIHNIDVDIPHSMDDFSLDPYIGGEARYGVNLMFVNPDYLDQAMADLAGRQLDNRYTIGCWFWELEKFPEQWRHALHLVDEVMVSTNFILDAIAKVTDKPVWRAPLPVNQSVDSGLARCDFALDEGDFIFLNSFDFNSYVARKNPGAVLEAFRRAFPDNRPNVKLLIKSSNGHRHPEQLRALLNAVGTDNHIIVRDDVLDRRDLGALQRCANAFVSLHRSEGFGLALAECMGMGKPVVATAWSGNMDFMTAANSCLVDYRLVPVGEGEYPYHVGQRWAEPDLDHAAKLMRKLVDEPDFASAIGAQAARDIHARLSPHEAAQKIIRRIESRVSELAPAPRAVGVSADTGRQEQAS